jgi:hypothetical protein
MVPLRVAAPMTACKGANNDMRVDDLEASSELDAQSAA